MKNENPPKVFISYSWDSEAHKEWVLNLANQLIIVGGVEVILDQYELKAGKNLNLFMEKAVTEADKVLVIMTDGFHQKAKGRKGGVGYEYTMISTAWAGIQANNDKFIPVLRGGDYTTAVPIFVQSFLYEDMRDDADFDGQLERLIRNIYNAPKIVKPKPSGRPAFLDEEVELPKADPIPQATLEQLKAERNKQELTTLREKLTALENELATATDMGSTTRRMKETILRQTQEKITRLEQKMGITSTNTIPPKDYEATKQAIQKLIANNKIKAAIDQLLATAKEKKDADLDTQVLMQSANYQGYLRDNRMGILSGDEGRRILARVTVALLELVGEV